MAQIFSISHIVTRTRPIIPEYSPIIFTFCYLGGIIGACLPVY